MKIRLRFVWQDMWLGVYIDDTHKRIYICVIPMFPLIISYGGFKVKWDYPWMWGMDLKSTYKSIWLGWWLVVFTTGPFDNFSISFQPGL